MAFYNNNNFKCGKNFYFFALIFTIIAISFAISSFHVNCAANANELVESRNSEPLTTEDEDNMEVIAANNDNEVERAQKSFMNKNAKKITFGLVGLAALAVIGLIYYIFFSGAKTPGAAGADPNDPNKNSKSQNAKTSTAAKPAK